MITFVPEITKIAGIEGLTKPRKIYLSGGMKGYPHSNIPLFYRVANMLRRERIIVVNPPELDTAIDMDLKEATDFNNPDQLFLLWVHMMRRDLSLLLEECEEDEEFDGIMLLPKWPESSGSKAELFIMQHVLGTPAWALDAEALVNDKLLCREITSNYEMTYDFVDDASHQTFPVNAGLPIA